MQGGWEAGLDGGLMNFYTYRFDNIEQYLHHRPPYLLVDGILEIAEDSIRKEKQVRGDEFYIQGHFPGAPILPGAMMQEFVTQSAGILIAANYNPMREFDTNDPRFNEFALGVLVKVKSAKYKSFARVGDLLEAKVKLRELVSNIFEFSAEIRVGDANIMNARFQLTNIPSTTLRGVTAC